MPELNIDLTNDPIQTAIETFSAPITMQDAQNEVVDMEFLEAVARAENEPLYNQYIEDPKAEVEAFDATGDAKGRSEIGFGYTFKTGTKHGIRTAQDATSNLQKRYVGLIDKIATKSERFSNIKKMPLPYQGVLLSIADNVGITGLDAYEQLQKAMAKGDSREIYNQMLTKVKKANGYADLNSRRDKIFQGSRV